MKPFIQKSKNLESKSFEFRIISNDVPYKGEMVEINSKEKYARFQAKKCPSQGNRCEWQIHSPSGLQTGGTGTISQLEQVEINAVNIQRVKIKLLQLNQMEIEKIEKELVILQENMTKNISSFKGN